MLNFADERSVSFLRKGKGVFFKQSSYGVGRLSQLSIEPLVGNLALEERPDTSRQRTD